MIKRASISVVICTRDRADSLGLTLDHIVSSNRAGIDLEVIVVDNDSQDATRSIVESFAPTLPIHYLFEPVHGKSHALNLSLRRKKLHDIILFLDDDMSPETDWLQEVASSCASWPAADFFGGRTSVEWPHSSVPRWALVPSIQGWAYSVEDHGRTDTRMARGEWPAPNCFWIRARVLASGHQFSPVWATEPHFILDLWRDGFWGVRSGMFAAKHRVQDHLLDEGSIRDRAVLVGRSFAQLSMRDPKVTRPARLFQKHPIIGRCFCVIQLGLWSLRYVLSWFWPLRDDRFARSARALERCTYFSEVLRIASSTKRT